MDDPIPAGSIGLPEALQRIAAYVSDAHLEREKSDFQDRLQALEAIQTANATGEAASAERANSSRVRIAAEELWRYSSKRDFALEKLYQALQAGAISAMVRAPESGSLFRLTQYDWHSEPFWEQIIRGGVIPPHAGRGLECHRERTVLIETTCFEEWLARAVNAWPQASGLDLARRWLIREMTASPIDKKMTKDQWYEAAKARFSLSRREFDVAWSDALAVVADAKWGRPGAPHKSSQ